MPEFFPDEQQVTQSNDKSVTLTTHRISYSYKDWGRSYHQSILLEHITSCECFTGSLIIFLILGILTAVIGILGAINGDSQYLGAIILVSLFLLIIYWLSRQAYIVIGSPSTKMKIKMSGLNRENMIDFINKVELTKNQKAK